MVRKRIVLFIVLLFTGSLAYACGSELKENKAEDNKVKIYFYLPDALHAEKDLFVEKLQHAMSENGVGEILSTDKSGRTIEITVKIIDLESINKAKRIFINLSPETEYRIEHL